MRVRAHAARGRCRRARAARRRARARAALSMLLVRAHHVDELVADAHHRVERVHRALEDHRDVAPAEAAQLLGAHADDVLAAEEDAAAGDCGRAARRICMTAFAIVLLPQPDSPARPSDLALRGSRGRRRRPRAPAARRSRTRRRARRSSSSVSRSARGSRAAARAGRHALLLARPRPPPTSVRRRPRRRFCSVRRRGLLTSSMPARMKTSPSDGERERDAREEERPPLALEHGRVRLRPVERHAPARRRRCRRGRGTRGPASMSSAT